MGLAHSSAQDSSEQPCTASGDVFLYNESLGMAAFEVGGYGSESRALVCIPGLTDGLLSLRYLPELAEAVRQQGWRVIQPILCSSYSGWGAGHLDSDVQDIDVLLDFLEAHRGVNDFALLGHSTGCQDVVRYLQIGKRASAIRAAILQAPVSDREALLATGADPADLERYRRMAKRMIAERKGEEAMPRSASLLLGPPHIVTANRFNSLTGQMTDDDMFSSDLSDDDLLTRLGHMALPTLIVTSLDDEYVPDFVDPRKLTSRMADAMAASSVGAVQQLCLEEGGHGLTTPKGAARPFIAAVQSFLGGISCKPPLTWEIRVAKHIRDLSDSVPDGQPLMVALSGIPGSGKSTASAALRRLIGPSCLVVPMDGYHLPLADLRARPDAEEAEYRRGAPDTFDPAELLQQLDAIRTPKGPLEVLLPGFDHAVGDPVPGEVCFVRNKHAIVLVEGLYLLHDDDGWENISAAFDYRVYIDSDIDECISRVKIRNKCIPGYTPEEIDLRCEKVDRKNALTVQRSKRRADEVVESGLQSP